MVKGKTVNRHEKLDFIAKALGITKASICHILGLSRCWGHFPDAGTANDDRLSKMIEYIEDKDSYDDARQIVDSIPEHKRPMVMSMMMGETKNQEVKQNDEA